MKKIIISLVGAVFLCGCNKQTSTPGSDSAKIEALSKELNVVLLNQGITISNQIIIWKEIEVVKAEVTNLPSMDQIDSMAHFYNTNEINFLYGFFTNLPSIDQVNSMDDFYFTNEVSKMVGLSTNETEFIADELLFFSTNTPTHAAGEPNDIERMLKIERESDFEQMKVDVDDMQEDLRKIKARLGIVN